MTEHQNLLSVKQFVISPDLFTKGFPTEGGPCTCTSVCCEGGVYADVRARDKIMAHKDVIKKYMDQTQTTDDSLWFEDHEDDDADFASGRCVGTREINDKCAFLDMHRRCTLQVAATGEGMHRWALKPLFCILYPIEISDNVVNVEEMLQDGQKCCSVDSEFQIPVFEACKEELVYLVGEDGFRTMEDHYASLWESCSANITAKD